MARYVARGAGLTERQVKVPETMEEAVAAWKAVAAQFPAAQPGDWTGDALHRANADRCREILANVGLQDRGEGIADRRALEAAGSGEGSAAYIAAHWLAEYHKFLRCRERIEGGDTSPANLGMMAWAVHAMGRLQEEMRWRPGIDPDTGKAREALALGKKRQELSRPKATAARKEQAAEDEPEWWDDARQKALEIRRKKPGYSRCRVAAEIAPLLRRSSRQVQEVLRPLWP